MYLISGQPTNKNVSRRLHKRPPLVQIVLYGLALFLALFSINTSYPYYNLDSSYSSSSSSSSFQARGRRSVDITTATTTTIRPREEERSRKHQTNVIVSEDATRAHTDNNKQPPDNNNNKKKKKEEGGNEKSTTKTKEYDEETISRDGEVLDTTILDLLPPRPRQNHTKKMEDEEAQEETTKHDDNRLKQTNSTQNKNNKTDNENKVIKEQQQQLTTEEGGFSSRMYESLLENLEERAKWRKRYYKEHRDNQTTKDDTTTNTTTTAIENDDISILPLFPPPLPYKPEPGKVSVGVLSTAPQSFFHEIRYRIDNVHPYDRCPQYSFLKKKKKKVNTNDASNLTSSTTTITNPPQKRRRRRIFFGALIADEPEELFHIVGAETYEIFEGIVFVESNRTQHFVERPFQRLGQEDHMRTLFGKNTQIQIRSYVDEDPMLLDLAREHQARQEILVGWKEMGMRPNDIGYLADIDETFTRDFLRALQECPDIDSFNYQSHRCHPERARIIGAARVFEAAPDCIAKGRAWHHPDVVIGACIELIADDDDDDDDNTTKTTKTNKNNIIIAPRENIFERADGYANQCNEFGYRNIINNKNNDNTSNSSNDSSSDYYFPLYNGADFRRMCGGAMVRNRARGHTEYTAYHFHNFFENFNQTRFKYKTYGHPQYGAFTQKLERIHADTMLVSQCVNNISNAESKKMMMTTAETTYKFKNKDMKIHQREENGLDATQPFWPVYFWDKDYRARKFQSLRNAFISDETSRKAYVKSREEAELARRAKLFKLIQTNPQKNKNNKTGDDEQQQQQQQQQQLKVEGGFSSRAQESLLENLQERAKWRKQYYNELRNHQTY